MSLRARILLLVLVSMLPPAATLIYVQIDERAELIAEARRHLSVLARGAALDLENRLRGAAQVAYALAQLPALDTPDRAACSDLLGDFVGRYPEYGIVATLLPDGTLHCGSPPDWKQLRLNVSDRDYFRRALASHEAQFESVISRVTGKPVVFAAYAARDRAGTPRFVVAVTIDLARYAAAATTISRYDDNVFSLWDRRDGTLLMRHPEAGGEILSGSKLPETALFRFVEHAADGDTTEVAGVDDVPRVYAVGELPNLRGLSLRFTMGVSSAELTAVADQRLHNALWFTGALLLVAVAGVWMLAERGIRRPAARIIGTVLRFSGGDLDARIGQPYPRGELGELMSALDQTADMLQRQRVEIEALNADLERRVAQRTADLEASRCETENQRNVYWSLLDAATDGLALADRDRIVRHVNRAFADLFGLGNTTLLIDQPDEAFRDRVLLALAEPEKYSAEMERVWRHPDASGEFELAGRDGRRRFLFFSTPVHDAEGHTVGRALACRDVSREREIERMKNEFVATVSHELRTPLASLLGFSELMLTRELSESKRRHFTEVIHTESIRLNSLINDFLDLQRLESGRAQYRFEPVAVDALLAETATLYADNPRHPLRVESLPAPLHVLADRDRITQVLNNLLSNAVKFSPAGGALLLTARVVDDAVEISVRDHGLGIPAEALPKLFEKFYRVDASDRSAIGGTGLGLALCKEIVTAHHGRFHVESQPGAGSTFSFTLPAAESSAGSPPSGEMAPVGCDVLVVEDDASFAALVLEHLRELGLRAQVQASAEEALHTLQSVTPQLILLDIHLAGELDGWDFLIALKSDPRLARLPVIVTTVTEDQSRGFALGVSDYLIKPFQMETLHTLVLHYLPRPKNCSVLVVDDDARFRESVAEALRGEFDCTVREAADGDAALAALRHALPDLLILDLLMPGTDGFHVLAQLRADRDTARLPVLVVTGKDLSTTEKERLNQGMTQVLTKAEYRRERLRALAQELIGHAPAA